MKSLSRLLLVLMIAAGPALADDHEETKPGGTLVEATSIQATVEDIDLKDRIVTLKGEAGKLTKIKVGPAARNLDQVKKGDIVTVDYVQAVAIDIQKAEGDLSSTVDVVVERAAKGQMPAGVVTGTVTVKGLITAIDHKARTVTIKGPEGNEVTLKVGEQAKRFHEVKKGEEVVVVYTEALGISVTKPE